MAASLIPLLTVLVLPLLSLLLTATKRSSSHPRRGNNGRRLPPSPPCGLPLLGHLRRSRAVISRAAFGDSVYELEGDDGGRGTKLRKVFGDLEELLGTVPMAETVPWLWLVDMVTGLERKVRRTFKEIDRLLERVVDDHSQRRRGGRRARDGGDDDDHRDFVDEPLDLKDTEEEVGGVQIDTVTIKALILDMIAAGTDTSYTMLEWAMAELINHPHQIRKLQDEIRAAVGVTGRINEDDLHKLPYLKAVIEETLRLHPPGPLLVPRETLEDTELLGYHVPLAPASLSTLGPSHGILGRGSALKSSCLSGSRTKTDCLLAQDFRFVLFGEGRRGCPGVGFAAPAMELALASLLYHFDWELPAGGVSKLEMDELNVYPCGSRRCCF